jgi:hypothetical protein
MFVFVCGYVFIWCGAFDVFTYVFRWGVCHLSCVGLV